jgi:hypothetical protein
VKADPPAWIFEHSVLAGVPSEAAWAYWTNVANWRFDTSIETVRLDGPFAAGSRGVTKPRGADLVSWRIRDAAPGHAIIEIELPGAVARFQWTFTPAESGTRITQRVTLSGPSSGQYLAVAQSQLAAGIPAGMRMLAAAMEHHDED